MKKFYAFLAAALISMSAFAADVQPSDAVLADYYEQGDVCVCIFVPANMACNDIVLAGSFHADANGWIISPVSDLPHFEAVEGYDGWYVASFTPEETPDETKGIQAKPVMLDVDGKFNWEYQVGTATVIRGGVQIVAGYSGEIDLINYATDAPNVYSIDSWKQNPCTAVYHNYTVTVISDGCDGYVWPYIVGAMNSWDFQQMQFDYAKSQENGAPTYYATFKAAEGTPYQVVSGMMDIQGVVPTKGDSAAGWKDIAYMQKLVDGVWGRIPGEDGDNQLTHEDANIVWDLRAGDLRWARCAPQEDPEFVVFRIMLPEENKPEAIEIIGTFDDWQGTAMEFVSPEGGMPHYIAKFEARPSQFFKFRSAGLWPNEGGSELELYNAENDVWETIKDNQFIFSQLWEDDVEKGQPCKSINLDWSNPDNYRWSAAQQGIENIVLTEKAQKVVVDGVIYIVRDNKMFNLQGAQVR